MRFETTNFARFFEKDYLRDFRPEAGRFRTFLRASISHFLANEWDRERALKRGGGQVRISFDAATAEERLRLEPVDRLTPEAIFERTWAAALLARCLERLREEQKATGGEERFLRLKSFLASDGASADYAALASELGQGESTLRVAVHRLRRRFAAVLREEVARTVADPADVDGEIRFMLETLRSGRRRGPLLGLSAVAGVVGGRDPDRGGERSAARDGLATRDASGRTRAHAQLDWCRRRGAGVGNAGRAAAPSRPTAASRGGRGGAGLRGQHRSRWATTWSRSART